MVEERITGTGTILPLGVLTTTVRRRLEHLTAPIGTIQDGVLPSDTPWLSVQ
ncbi:hypothetical protein [Nonomuraea sp. 10N515B]|uniref:hypothetical protein n=1 Tax=Nonomuraea sp. 10N515B TaxID=3457422 RepID=UPI003FCDC680